MPLAIFEYPVETALTASMTGNAADLLYLQDDDIGTSDADVREAMSGNICRCGAYKNIVAAIQSARGSV